MKRIATIKGESGTRITLSYDDATKELYADAEQIGPRFEDEDDAAYYILDSYSDSAGGDWDLRWADDE